MKPAEEPLFPLKPGDLALRFRIDWIQLWPGRHYQDTKPVVRGMEVVQVIAQDGNRVLWTNQKQASFTPGQTFHHHCDRRELISLEWFNTFAGGADSCAVPITAVQP